MRCVQAATAKRKEGGGRGRERRIRKTIKKAKKYVFLLFRKTGTYCVKRLAAENFGQKRVR